MDNGKTPDGHLKGYTGRPTAFTPPGIQLPMEYPASSASAGGNDIIEGEFRVVDDAQPETGGDAPQLPPGGYPVAAGLATEIQMSITAEAK